MASEWLRLMLEEIARKRDEQERAGVEEAQRQRDNAGAAAAPANRSSSEPSPSRREP